jgi:hypothetical protein
MSSSEDREIASAIVAGIFDINVKLDVIARNVVAIRELLDDEAEEEEEEID